MLQESLREIAKTLPSVLGFAGGISSLLGNKPKPDPPKKAACFPGACKDAAAPKTPDGNIKED